MRGFKPISLMNSMYKILAKVLANRLKMIMNSVIGDNQMAFVKNRQIMDSFVVAKEIIHSWRKDKVDGLLVKLDFVERGLRQRDLLSPFLFNLVVECLSGCLKKVVDLNLLRGISFGEDAVHMSHLQYANDTIIFLEPKLDFLVNGKRIMRCFEMASGLRINFHKSCVVRVGKKVSRRLIGRLFLSVRKPNFRFRTLECLWEQSLAPTLSENLL